MRPSLVQPLQAHRLRRAQLLRKEAHPQLLQQPAHLLQARVLHTFALGHQAPEALILRAQFRQFGGVPRRVRARLVDARLHRFEVAREVVQLGVGRGHQEALGHQALQLLRHIVGSGRPSP